MLSKCGRLEELDTMSISRTALPTTIGTSAPDESKDCRASGGSSTDVDQPPTLSERIDDFLTNDTKWALFVIVLTVWALFATDIQAICVSKDADTAFFVVTLIILVIFAGEFIATAIVQDNFMTSYQALMDFLAVLSLVPFENLSSVLGSIGENFSVARVARVAKALRILRATRAAALALKSQAKAKHIHRAAQRKKGLLAEESTSVLEDTLLTRTNTKMLLGILVLLMGTTLLTPTEKNNMAETGISTLDVIYGQNYLPSPSNSSSGESGWEDIWHDYRDQVQASGSKRKLKYLKVYNVVYLSLDTSQLRSTEFQTIAINDGRTEVQISLREKVVVSAACSIGLTCFAIVVILVWTGSFSRDHQRLVIVPVNRMIEVLRKMSQDPRSAISVCYLDKIGEEENLTEIEQIELCVGRFGRLLKVGFGEAGMGVIQRNMGNNETFDPVIPGQIVQAVFGFCDIRNFTDTCEVLNEETMVFTNNIADIVHDLVEESGGSVNKNIGDAFLSVWKLRAKIGQNGRTYVHHLTGAEAIVDSTLNAFIKMNEQLRTNTTIQEMCKDKRLQEKIPNYTVKMGYGLHLGWAVEGAVGSEYKVDATYLSSNVNMASFLESCTKQYRVMILMSDAFVEAMQLSFRKECRPIDCIRIKGYKNQFTLYCHMPTEAPQLVGSSWREFMEVWEELFEMYVGGLDWPRALQLIQRCLDILPTDGPSEFLRKTIMKHSGRESEWPGYHEFD